MLFRELDEIRTILLWGESGFFWRCPRFVVGAAVKGYMTVSFWRSLTAVVFQCNILARNRYRGDDDALDSGRWTEGEKCDT